MNLKFDILGEIKSGRYQGCYLTILDENQLSGGFYLYLYATVEGHSSFERWFDTYDDLIDYFREHDVSVKWVDIKINLMGKLLTGEYQGNYVKVFTEQIGEPPYYILIFLEKETFDEWLIDYDHVEWYFLDHQWEVQWSQTEIKLNTLGEIVSGEHQGQYIKVIKDPDSIHGHLVYISDDANEKNRIVYRLRSFERVEIMAVDYNWQIKWFT